MKGRLPDTNDNKAMQCLVKQKVNENIVIMKETTVFTAEEFFHSNELFKVIREDNVSKESFISLIASELVSI